MRRKALQALYTIETRVDPVTRKDKKYARYIGKTFKLDMAVKQRITRILWEMWLVAAAAFILGGLLNNNGSRCIYVVPFYAASLFPLFYMMMAVIQITRMKETINEVQKADGLHSAENCAFGMMVVGGLWALGDIVFMLLGGAGDLIGKELGFLMCGLMMAGCGYVAKKGLTRLKPEELPSVDKNGADNA